MNSDKSIRKDIFISAVLGAVIFILIYGVRILNPGYTDWLMNNIGGGIDSAQHYLGWVFYRESVWLSPPGMLNTIAWPIESSVIFTDSIPAFAFLFKILSPAIPAGFQYFGLYGILCFCLQSMFGTLVLRKTGCSRMLSFLGGVLFTLSPVMIDRMFRHTALGSQWLILMSLYGFINCKNKDRDLGKECIFWAVAGYLTGGIHLYFLPMTGIFCFAAMVYSLIKTRKPRYLSLLVSFTGGTALSVYMFGGFSAGVSAESDGLGDYSFNLNGMFNPMDRSSFIKELEMAFPGQNEGFAYLGLGVILLLISGLVIFLVTVIRKRRFDHDGLMLAGGICIFVCMFIFSLSPVITGGNRVLFTIPIHSKTRHLWNIFRSSGRMIWPCIYILITAGMVMLSDLEKIRVRQPRWLPTALLCICVLLQVLDLNSWLGRIHSVFHKDQVYESEMTGEYWEELAKGKTHVFVSDAVTSSESRVYESAKWAADHNLTINNFYFARGIPGVRDEYNKRMEEPKSGDVFLFTPEDPELERAGQFLKLQEQGRYITGLPYD
ncbi:MAG: DUF6311 domain-containing protein [Lachnospiraceae bacterium]|nr:DUF6311 domain-containing protein [Lachnospiraceae bacterium]